MNRERFQIGERVRVKKHWLREGHEGEIADYEPRRGHNWLVKFDIEFTGGGFDGSLLYMHEADLEPVKTVKRRKAA